MNADAPAVCRAESNIKHRRSKHTRRVCIGAQLQPCCHSLTQDLGFKPSGPHRFRLTELNVHKTVKPDTHAGTRSCLRNECKSRDRQAPLRTRREELLLLLRGMRRKIQSRPGEISECPGTAVRLGDAGRRKTSHCLRPSPAEPAAHSAFIKNHSLRMPHVPRDPRTQAGRLPFLRDGP